MQRLSVAEAAKRLGVSARRVQQLVKSGRLPADEFGGAFVIKEKDLELVANRRPGRPLSERKNREKSARTSSITKSTKGRKEAS